MAIDRAVTHKAAQVGEAAREPAVKSEEGAFTEFTVRLPRTHHPAAKSA